MMQLYVGNSMWHSIWSKLLVWQNSTHRWTSVKTVMLCTVCWLQPSTRPREHSLKDALVVWTDRQQFVDLTILPQLCNLDSKPSRAHLVWLQSAGKVIGFAQSREMSPINFNHPHQKSKTKHAEYALFWTHCIARWVCKAGTTTLPLHLAVSK